MTTPREITELPSPDEFWKYVHITSDNQCWLWTDSTRRDGYGYFYYHGQSFVAHRMAFALSEHIPTPQEIICHTCDIKVCCNPAHLYSGTHKTNAQDRLERNPNMIGDGHWARKQPDRVRRGEACPQSSLTADLVREIRTRYAQGDISQKALSEQYGVATNALNAILLRKTWQHSDDIQPPKDRHSQPGKEGRRVSGSEHHNARFTVDDVLRIRQLAKEYVPLSKIAREYGCSRNAINCIVRRITWNHIPDHL